MIAFFGMMFVIFICIIIIFSISANKEKDSRFEEEMKEIQEELEKLKREREKRKG